VRSEMEAAARPPGNGRSGLRNQDRNPRACGAVVLDGLAGRCAFVRKREATLRADRKSDDFEALWERSKRLWRWAVKVGFAVRPETVFETFFAGAVCV
jgi:hypothetical protein